MSKYEELPLLDSADAISLMQSLVDAGEGWVAVFVDRGWGDPGTPLEITIIVNGNGQKPLARMTKEIKDELLRSGRIAPNSLRTYKARKCHDFVAVAPSNAEVKPE